MTTIIRHIGRAAWLVAAISLPLISAGAGGKRPRAAETVTANRIVAAATSATVTIDGQLNEAAWQQALAAKGFSVVGLRPRQPRVPTVVRVMTNGADLFIGFHCSEPEMDILAATRRENDDKAYLDDSVEIILDPANDRRVLFHLIANAVGSRHDARAEIRETNVDEKAEWNGKWEMAASKAEKGWSAEFRIPLADVGVQPGLPRTLGLNLCRTRAGALREYSSWMHCEARFMEPGRLGELILPMPGGDFCAAEMPQGIECLVGAKLPQVQVVSRYGSARQLRCSYELHGPAGHVVSGASRPFDVAARGSARVELDVCPVQNGPHRLALRLEDAASGRLEHRMSRDFTVHPELELVLDPVALYSHRLDATVRSRHPDARRRGSVLAVDLCREGGTTPIATLRKRSPLAAAAALSFDLRQTSAARLQVSAKLLRGDEVVSSAPACTIAYDPEPAFALDGDGFLHAGAQPFFPVGMYTLQDRRGNHDAVLAEAKQAGFNTTVFYAYKLPDLLELMDAADRNGIKAWVYVSDPYKIRTGKWDASMVARDVDARTTHPALMGWYLVDEPEGIGETNPHTVRRLYDTVKAADADHPSALVVMSPQAAERYADSGDIMWIDPYPVPHTPVTFVSECVAGARKAVGGRKPVWAVLQAFDWSVWKSGTIDKIHRPTPQEVRCMTYLALVHGAQGIIYWAHTASKYYIRDYPEHWEAMKKIAGELRDLTPVLVSASAAKKVSVSPGAAPLDTMARVHGNSIVVIAVNRETTGCTASLRVDGTDRKAPVEVLFENRTIQPADGGWKDEFPPLGVHVYRLPARAR